jgi:hypothetical protein
VHPEPRHPLALMGMGAAVISFLGAVAFGIAVYTVALQFGYDLAEHREAAVLLVLVGGFGWLVGTMLIVRRWA